MFHSRKRYQKIILAMDDAMTTSRDLNVAGLSSAITLATALRIQYSAHVADVTAGEVTGEHKALHAAGQLAATSVVPYNLATLLTLVNDLTAKYTCITPMRQAQSRPTTRRRILPKRLLRRQP